MMMTTTVLVMAALSANPATKTWSFTVGKAPKIDLSSISGSVLVQADGTDQVKIELTPAREGAELKVDADGDNIDIEAGGCESNAPHCKAVPVAVVIRAPKHTELDISTVSAGVTLK